MFIVYPLLIFKNSRVFRESPHHPDILCVSGFSGLQADETRDSASLPCGCWLSTKSHDVVCSREILRTKTMSMRSAKWWSSALLMRSWVETPIWCPHFPSKCLESQDFPWIVELELNHCMCFYPNQWKVSGLQFDRWFSAVSRSCHVLLLPEPWWLLYRRKAQRPNQLWSLCDKRLREENVNKSRN